MVKTDRNSLRYFLEQKDLNKRQQKWVSRIQPYDFDIKYVKGKKNVVVDAFLGCQQLALSWRSVVIGGHFY